LRIFSKVSAFYPVYFSLSSQDDIAGTPVMTVNDRGESDMQTSNLAICAITTTMMTKHRSREALATSDDPAARAYLEPYLYDENTETRLAAIDALGKQEDPAAMPALAGLLSDQDTSIRNYAVNALGEIDGADAIAYLLQARNDPQANICANVDAILQEIAAAAAD
jgi:hypothetical protein